MTGTQVAPVPAIIGGSNDITPLKTPTLPIKSIESVHLRTAIAGNDNVIGVVHSTTFVNGSGDSKKLTKDMDKKEITVNGGKLGDSTPANKPPQQTASSAGTILKNDCIDLDKNFVAVDLKNLKDNSLLVNNLKSIGVGVRAPINTVTPNGNTTQKMGTKTANGTSFETDEDTSSSDYSSEDETERMLRVKLERERQDIAWRWHWLDLQTRELQHQIQQADQQYLKLRRSKQPVVPPVDDFDTLRSLRTSSMGTLKKSRKLCRRAPTNLSGRIVEGAEPHPLFSFPERKSLHRSSSSREPGSPEPNSPSKPEQPKRRRDSNRKKEVCVKTEVEEDDVATRPNRKRRNTDSPQSPLFTPPTTPGATPKMSEKKKKTLKTRDFDIDNVVIPFGMGSSCTIPVIHYKEIITPKWRSVDAPDFSKKGSRKRKALSPINTPDQSPHPSPRLSTDGENSGVQTLPISPRVPVLQAPPFKRLSGSKSSTKTTTSANLESSQEAIPIKEKPLSCESENPPARFSILSDDDAVSECDGINDSSDEDTSDEAFARRHMKQEVSERQRYLLPKKKNTTEATPHDASITNLFVTSHDDLLSTYSPKPAGSLLPAELFTEPSKEPAQPTSPTEATQDTSLGVQKDKLKEKLAKVRHSYGAESEEKSTTPRATRTSSAPSKLSTKPTKTDNSDTEDEEWPASPVEPEPPKPIKEEEYLPGEKRRSRKFQPIRTRSRAAALDAAAAAARALRASQPKTSSSSTKKKTKKPAPAKVPTPVPSPAPEPITSVSTVAESDGYLSDEEDEEDWDEWEVSCDKVGKWWWEPAKWEIIPAGKPASEAQALRINLYRTAIATSPCAADVPTPQFPSFAELEVAQTLKETPMAEATATETVTLETISMSGSNSTLLSMEVDTQPADDIVMVDASSENQGALDVGVVGEPSGDLLTISAIASHSTDGTIESDIDTSVITTATDIDTSTDLDLSATTFEPMDMDHTTKGSSTTEDTNTNTTSNTHTETGPSAEPQHPLQSKPKPKPKPNPKPSHQPTPTTEPQPTTITTATTPPTTSTTSSPPTTPPLIASPDDDIILLISPLRSDSDEYTLLPLSHTHLSSDPPPVTSPIDTNRDNIVFPAHHNNPVE